MTPTPLPPSLARLHGWMHAQPWLTRFTLLNRLLLAVAFFPTGLVKATGQRFSTLPVDHPVGFFFEAMYQTGPYWLFIGLMQMAAAVLLLIPATATLGALLFFPIVVSIFLITWGVGFSGTVYVTAAMVLSATYLLCWDADRLWAAARLLVGRRTGPALLAGAPAVEKAGWVLGGTAAMGLFLATRNFVPPAWVPALLALALAAAVLVLIGWGVALRRRRSPGGNPAPARPS